LQVGHCAMIIRTWQPLGQFLHCLKIEMSATYLIAMPSFVIR